MSTVGTLKYVYDREIPRLNTVFQLLRLPDEMQMNYNNKEVLITGVYLTLCSAHMLHKTNF